MADHLLRLIDRHIRFDFIRIETESLYCANNGRPAIDPVVLVKMLFIGYLFGVRSERSHGGFPPRFTTGLRSSLFSARFP